MIHADHAAIRGPGGHDDAIERRRAELRLRITREKHLSYDREQLQRLSPGCPAASPACTSAG